MGNDVKDFGCGLICGWAALTVRQQGTLVYLISVVGLPQPSAVWLGYMIPELVLPWIMFAAHRISARSLPV